MKKAIFTLLIFPFFILALSFFFFSRSLAAAFQITKIGALDTTGKSYSEWWYTGVNPMLSGTGAISTDVTVKIGTQTFKTTADSQGNWNYQIALDKGDYDVTLTQDQSNINFKLHLGQNLPSGSGALTVSSGQGQTPETGFNQLVSIGFGLGIVFLATYFYILGDPRRKSVFEAKILKED